MNTDDNRRFFIVISVIMEVVTPALGKWLINKVQMIGHGCFQAFLDSQPIKHLLFHLRHRNAQCCTDKKNCQKTQTIQLHKYQWDLLYAENPGNHKCHCNFNAKPIHVEDLDITLATLILINCCYLSRAEEHLIKAIRQFKNENLSHTTSMSITEEKFKILWTELTSFVLQLDSSKKDELARIQNLPLDALLCQQYYTCLIDLQKKTEDVKTEILQAVEDVKTEIIQAADFFYKITKDIKTEICHEITDVKKDFSTILKKITELNLEKKQHYNKEGNREGHTERCTCQSDTVQGVENFEPQWEKLMFYQIEQLDLSSLLFPHTSHSCLPPITWKKNKSIPGARAVMMDDGTVILCSDHSLMILSVDKTGTQPVQMAFADELIEIAVLTSCTVAILLPKCIQTIDVYLKQLITTIPVPETCKHITNNSYNHLVVASYFRTFIVDPWTPQVVRTIGRDPYHEYLHAFDNRIYYSDYENCLHCFYFSVELQQSGTRQEEYLGEEVFKKKITIISQDSYDTTRW